jgi:hypothetical protein
VKSRYRKGLTKTTTKNIKSDGGVGRIKINRRPENQSKVGMGAGKRDTVRSVQMKEE